MKYEKYYAFLLTVLVSVLCGCSDNKEETEKKTEIVQVIEGTCIVRAKDREKETLDSTTTVENTEIIEDAETIIVENTETVDEESNKSETTVLEERCLWCDYKETEIIPAGHQIVVDGRCNRCGIEV